MLIQLSKRAHKPDGLLGHLVELQLSAALLAIGRVLGDDALLHGLVETGDELLELLRGIVLLVSISGLEELLVGVMELRLAARVTRTGLGVLTITFTGGTSAFGISHCLLTPVFGCLVAYYTLFQFMKQGGGF